MDEGLQAQLRAKGLPVDTDGLCAWLTTGHRELALWRNQRGMWEVWSPWSGVAFRAKGVTLTDALGQLALTFVAQVNAGTA